MNEYADVIVDFNIDILNDPRYKEYNHLNQSTILSYVDKLMSQKSYCEERVKHLEECSFCKNKVMKLLDYYGFSELLLR